MIEQAELERIMAAQFKSWEENKGVIVAPPTVSPLRAKRLNWLAKMRAKLKRKKHDHVR